jgi:hypothetical protein
MALSTGSALANGNLTATVPNSFERRCSTIWHKCGHYHQVNRPYSPAAPSIYTTSRCRCWIW